MLHCMGQYRVTLGQVLIQINNEGTQMFIVNKKQKFMQVVVSKNAIMTKYYTVI